MATTTSALTTLRTCLDAAKEAIISGEIDRAIDLCFHVLCSYPKSIEAHCLLGEAYREKGLVDQAKDTFRRVLSADPENLIARWALSILEEDKGDIDSALWSLQRAFELHPGHNELRHELARLSQDYVFLTRGALGRIYARGELFDRAAAEFRAILAAEPDRLDVLVALAETFWRWGRYDDAKAICERSLEESADCLKANIILGHILSSSGNKDKGQALLDRAMALDPENAVAAQMLDGLDVESLLQKREAQIPPFEDVDDMEWETVELLSKAQGEHGIEPDDALFDEDLILDDLLNSKIDPEPPAYLVEKSEELKHDDQWEFLESLEPQLGDEAIDVDSEEDGTVVEVAEDVVEISDVEPQELQEQISVPNELLQENVETDEKPVARLHAVPISMHPEMAGEVTDEKVVPAADNFINVRPQRPPADAQDPQISLERALAYSDAGQLEEAVKEFELVMRSAPSMIDQVIDALKAMLNSNPDFAPANRALGDAYMKIGRFRQAIDCYNQCLKK